MIGTNIFCNSCCEKWFPIAFFNFRGAAPPRPRIRHRSKTLSYELSLCLINSPVLNIDPPKSQAVYTNRKIIIISLIEYKVT